MKNIPLLLITVLMLNSCATDSAIDLQGEPSTEKITYSNHIQPIMQTSCATSGCHNSTNAGGYTLNNYNLVKQAFENGTAWSQIDSDLMPLGSNPLSVATKNTIKKWMETNYTK